MHLQEGGLSSYVTLNLGVCVVSVISTPAATRVHYFCSLEVIELAFYTGIKQPSRRALLFFPLLFLQLHIV